MKRIWPILVAAMLAALSPASVVAKAKVKVVQVATIVGMAPTTVVAVAPKFEMNNRPAAIEVGCGQSTDIDVCGKKLPASVAIGVTFSPLTKKTVLTSDMPVNNSDLGHIIIDMVAQQVERTGVGKTLVALTVINRSGGKTMKGKPFIHRTAMFLGRHRMNC